jgi:hypothetical protein
MKWYCTGAAVLTAAATLALGGCATAHETKTAEASNPCVGVAPPTGSLLRRKEDCSGKSQDEFEKQQTIDAIRARGGLGGSPMKPGG